uniref:Uncharacterized protein n=1 Tax=Tetranychus urticae TaxID=32264 RepID=T1JVB7_TETUR
MIPLFALFFQLYLYWDKLKSFYWFVTDADQLEYIIISSNQRIG